MAKSVEHPLPSTNLKKVPGEVHHSLGVRSVVTGEDYVDPNEVEWQKIFQKQADLAKVKD